MSTDRRARRPGPRPVRVRHRTERGAVPRHAATVPHVRPSAVETGLLDARTGWAAATPEEVRYRCGTQVTSWPLRSPGREVVRALVLHGPAAQGWRTGRTRGRFRPLPAADATARGDQRHWRPPVVLLLDADDAVVHAVPVRSWHPWGPVHGAGRGAGERPAGRSASAAAAEALLRRTGWDGLLDAAGLPRSEVHAVDDPELARVARATGPRAVPCVTAPRPPRAERRLHLTALAMTVLVGLVQWTGLPRRGDGPQPRDPGLDVATVGGWALLLLALLGAAAARGLRDRRARRVRPAEVAAGSRDGVQLLLGPGEGGRAEVGLRERRLEAWFPPEGPGAPAVLTVLRSGVAPGPRPHPWPAEVRFTTAAGDLVCVVPVHAFLGLVPDPRQDVPDALLRRLRELARRCGWRVEVVDHPGPAPVADTPPAGGGSTTAALALLGLALTTWWAARVALGGAGSWWVVGVGVVSLVVAWRALCPRSGRSRAGGPVLLP